MMGNAAMGRTSYLRGLMAALMLGMSACQSASAPDPQPASPAAPVPSTAMDKQPDPASASHKSHNQGSKKDVSALKHQLDQSLAVPQNTCTATAYVGKVNAAAVTVHQGPSNDAPVIGTIPTQEPVVVTVTGENAPWLSVTLGPESQGELAEPGWVQSARLAIQVHSPDPRPDGTAPLYAAPETSAAKRAEVVTGTEVLLLGCSGGWLKVQDLDNQSGWLAPEHQCSHPVSTCP